MLDSEAVPCSIKISSMYIYNAIRRKADSNTRLVLILNDSIELWLEKQCKTGWFVLHEPTPGEKG